MFGNNSHRLRLYILGKSSNRLPRTFKKSWLKVSKLLKQNLFQTLVKCIRNDFSKYATDQCIYWAFITSQTKVPSLCKVAFKRINESRVNAHMTLRHNKTWVDYYPILKERVLVLRAGCGIWLYQFQIIACLFALQFNNLFCFWESLVFRYFSSFKNCMIRCDFTKLLSPFFIAMVTE